MSPTGIEKIVCDDIAQRQAFGINKYGTTVAENPLQLREWLVHAYEETLDKAVYLRRSIAEIDRADRNPCGWAEVSGGDHREMFNGNEWNA